jgi:predicted metal-dependent peptidase
VASKGGDASTAREELSRSIIELLVKEPFFGHLLAGVMRSVSESTPTAAVALGPSGVELRINPTFFLKTLTRKPERIAVVKHECLHLLFKHLFRFDERRDPRMFNVAADVVVNQFVRPWKLPESAVTLESFPDLGLLPDQTADWYYDRLVALKNEMEKGGWKPGDEGSPDFSGTSAPQSADTLSRLVGSTWHSDHDGWAAGEGQDLPSAVREALESQLDRAILSARDRAGPKAWGNLPGPLQRLVEAVIERRKPKVDWRRAVRIFAASSRRTRIVGTWRKESRRYSREVQGESQPVPGIKIKQLSRLAVVVDTSGSVSDRDLSRFFAEVHAMWRQGVEVDVIECDAAVQRVYPYRGKLPEGVAGRGGTSFDPAFAWLCSVRRRTKYDGCIYLTDGGAPAPQERPPCKLLWVVTSDGMVGDHLLYGRVIQIPAE